MPDHPAETLFRLFNEVGIIEQLSRALFEARLPDGFLVSHFSVLNHLIRIGDGRTPLDLARAFQVPKTTMTHTLSVLERHEMVALTPNPKDGRSKRVWITDAGRAFRAQAIADLLPDLVRVSARLPGGLADRILPDMVALREVLDKMRDT